MNISKLVIIASVILFPLSSFAYIFEQSNWDYRLEVPANTNKDVATFQVTASTTLTQASFFYGSTFGTSGSVSAGTLEIVSGSNVCGDSVDLGAPFEAPQLYVTQLVTISGLGCDLIPNQTYTITLNRGLVGNQIATFSDVSNVPFFLLTASIDVDTIYIIRPDFDLAPCNLIGDFTNFDISECFEVLINPPEGTISVALEDIKDKIAYKVPWGYITRGIELFSTTSTTTLPALSITLPDMNTGSELDEMEMDFNPWQYFFVSGSPLNDTLVSSGADPKNVWEIFEDYFTWLVYFFLFVVVINDLMRLHKPHSKL